MVKEKKASRAIDSRVSNGMGKLQKLAEYFERFPGIGPRQSKRFVYFLLAQTPQFRAELAEYIKDLSIGVEECEKCHRYFSHNGDRGKICPLCNDANRSAGMIMIVEKDVDLDNVERGGLYDGYYFVLGGTVPTLEKNPNKKIRAEFLKRRIEDGAFKEIILALSATPNGDSTARYIQDLLRDVTEKKKMKVSTLGRGLSTGSELEYTDTETIKNALNNRG